MFAERGLGIIFLWDNYLLMYKIEVYCYFLHFQLAECKTVSFKRSHKFVSHWALFYLSVCICHSWPT